MMIVAFVGSALVTGFFLALFARTQGLHHEGILIAIGIIGAGIQMIIILGAYLRHTSERARRQAAKALPELQEPNADRIDGR